MLVGMKMPNPSEEDKERFRSLTPDDPLVTTRPMFGQLAAFVNGNMFMGLFGSQVGVKLDAPDREELMAVDGSGPFGPPERPMGGYATLPTDLPDEEVRRWIERALTHVGSLPPKAKK